MKIRINEVKQIDDKLIRIFLKNMNNVREESRIKRMLKRMLNWGRLDV